MSIDEFHNVVRSGECTVPTHFLSPKGWIRHS